MPKQCVYDFNFSALGNQFNTVRMLIIQILLPWIRCAFWFTLKIITLSQRARFDTLNLKFLNSSQIYAPTSIYYVFSIQASIYSLSRLLSGLLKKICIYPIQAFNNMLPLGFHSCFHLGFHKGFLLGFHLTF